MIRAAVNPGERVYRVHVMALQLWNCQVEWPYSVERCRDAARIRICGFYLRDKNMMTKVEAIVQPSRFEAVKEVLTELGIGGMTITDVRGHGRQKGHTEVYRGREYSVDLLPKVKLELVVADDLGEQVLQAIVRAAKTGKIGDGKIFVTRVDEAVRIRNEERGEVVL